MTSIIKQTGGNTASAYFDRDIGPEKGEISAAHFKGELSELDPDCEINFFFDCYGGSVPDGREIYKSIRGHQGPTTAHIQGICASIASVIAMACDEVLISADALYMIHNPHWSTSRSEAMCSVSNQKMITIPRQYRKQLPITIPTLATDKNAEVRRTLEENRRIIKKHKNRSKERKVLLEESRNLILDVYVLQTGANRQDLTEMMQAETWFTASDCIQFGFADSIVGPAGLVDHVDFSQFANPTNFLAGRYMNSAQTGRAKRRTKVNRKQVSHMQQRVQKILNNRQEA